MPNLVLRAFKVCEVLRVSRVFKEYKENEVTTDRRVFRVSRVFKEYKENEVTTDRRVFRVSRVFKVQLVPKANQVSTELTPFNRCLRVRM